MASFLNLALEGEEEEEEEEDEEEEEELREKSRPTHNPARNIGNSRAILQKPCVTVEYQVVVTKSHHILNIIP